MTTIYYAMLFAGGLFFGVVGSMEIGRRIGLRSAKALNDDERAGINALEGAIFGLMGLMIAFTFSGAMSRFNHRRDLLAEEVNAIGTAWQRLELLPVSAQPGLRELFRNYVDSRLATYRKMPDAEAAEAELARGAALQREIWTQATAASAGTNSPQAPLLLLPALNTMFDITTTRTMAVRAHAPNIIFAMLGALILASSLFAGYDMGGSRHRSRLHIMGFSAIMAITVYVILDLEYPRIGLIRLDAYDQVLVELRASMN